MIIQRLFSRTWTNIKGKKNRHEKAVKQNERRHEINARRDAILKEKEEGLKKSAMGTNFNEYKDKNGKKIKERVTAENVESKFKANMKDLNHYTDSILDKTSRKPKPTPKDVRSGFEKTVEVVKEKGKEVMKNPKTKKWGYIGAGSLVGTAAVSGVDAAVKKHKEKKKENEIREKIAGGKK